MKVNLATSIFWIINLSTSLDIRQSNSMFTLRLSWSVQLEPVTPVQMVVPAGTIVQLLPSSLSLELLLCPSRLKGSRADTEEVTANKSTNENWRLKNKSIFLPLCRADNFTLTKKRLFSADCDFKHDSATPFTCLTFYFYYIGQQNLMFKTKSHVSYCKLP